MNRAHLTQLAPQFDWGSFLEQKGLGAVEIIIAANSTAITDIGRLLEEVPMQTWKDYLTFHLISTAANSLPHRFDEAHFEFFSRTLMAVTQQRDRWKRGLTLVNGTLGEAVGRLYLERHFPASSRRLMSELVDNLRGAFAERLRTVDWMDETTRKEALAKLASFEIRVGGPVRFVDYSALQIDRNDIIGNRLRASAFQWDLQLAHLKNPVDRTLWAMTPQTINASYDPLRNQLTFPAGILQPPYFDPRADPAVNYGAIGSVIGHEMSHGFDDQGRRFDATGRVRDWWSAASARAFAQRAAGLGAQYAQYEGVPGLKVNAQLTMGENIGDLGGVNIAYAAYRRHVAKHGEPPILNGLTGDQRFFLAWAQLQRRSSREDVLRATLLTDPHSPPQWRLNGVVRNMDAWYRAFGIKQGDALFLPTRMRVRIW
jgi:endothelin-converting enzyme/putative endopeptidase